MALSSSMTPGKQLWKFHHLNVLAVPFSFPSADGGEHFTFWLKVLSKKKKKTVNFSPSCQCCLLTWASFVSLCSEEVARHGFTVIVDMRGSKWDSIKPLLKILQESFPSCIHVALIIKPDNFWQKQRTNFGSSKFEFEVSCSIPSTANL